MRPCAGIVQASRFKETFVQAEPVAGVDAGIGKGYKIKKIALLLSRIYNFNGKIFWNKSKPDGQKSKILDNELIRKNINWKQKINVEKGLTLTVKWFLKNKARNV